MGSTSTTDIHAMYEEFVRVFLSGDSLEHFLIYTCNASSVENSDPISNTVVLLLSSPVSISFSHVGVRAFKTTSVATLPYHLLDLEQCNLVRKMLHLMKDGLECQISSDASGGFSVQFPQPTTHTFLNKTEVMDRLSRAVNSTSGYKDGDAKERVFSILSQRIGALTVVPGGKQWSM